MSELNAPSLLCFSRNEDDLSFGRFMAQSTDHEFHSAQSGPEIQALLKYYPTAIVLWDIDDRTLEPLVLSAATKIKTNPNRWIAVSSLTPDKMEGNSIPAFVGHFWSRRYSDPAPFIYSSILKSLRMSQKFGLKRFFHDKDWYQKITLKRSTHKRAAVLATQKVLTDNHCTPRIATLVAQAVDELILNAIFEAPILPNGTHYQAALNPASDFELTQKEQVDVEFAVATDYFAISIIDQFGSLPTEKVRKLLLDGIPPAGHPDSDHLGLNGISRAGFSLLINCLRGQLTEVTLFIPRGTNVRQFRSGLRFTSLLIN
jgi:hypothetical protein